jgi:predicted acyltransferase
MYKEDYDPEGLLSTIPSIVTSILGIFTGLLLISKRANKTSLLCGLGVIFLIAGYVWGMVFPINKALWTSSYVLVTAGWANIVLALIYYLTDVKGLRFGGIFRYAGANAITVYFLSSFITKLFYSIEVDEETSLHEWLYQSIFVQDFLAPKFSSLLYGLCVVSFYVWLAYVLYRKKIFIKV